MIDINAPFRYNYTTTEIQAVLDEARKTKDVAWHAFMDNYYRDSPAHRGMNRVVYDRASDRENRIWCIMCMHMARVHIDRDYAKEWDV